MLFPTEEDTTSLSFSSIKRAEPQLKVSSLPITYFAMPEGKLFIDRKLPVPDINFKLNSTKVDSVHYVNLHNAVIKSSPQYP